MSIAQVAHRPFDEQRLVREFAESAQGDGGGATVVRHRADRRPLARRVAQVHLSQQTLIHRGNVEEYRRGGDSRRRDGGGGGGGGDGFFRCSGLRCGPSTEEESDQQQSEHLLPEPEAVAAAADRVAVAPAAAAAAS